ncbi:MAG: hypothetical protein RIT38_172 [Bacteroidota bacterium]|jgi:hypothetical protein
MYKILNQEKETVAYIQNMMILDKKKDKVIGLLIGDCFFGNDNKVIGKIIDQTVYLINGEIVGKVEMNKDKKDPAPKKGLMLEAWDILSNIKSHTSDWITISKKWSKKSLQEVLK